MRGFVCLDCGNLGTDDQLAYHDVPDTRYEGDSKSAVALAKKNALVYCGCPQCKSPNLCFTRPQVVNIPSTTIWRSNKSPGPPTFTNVEPAPADLESNLEVLDLGQHSIDVEEVRPAKAVKDAALEDSETEFAPKEVEDDGVDVISRRSTKPRPKRAFSKKCKGCGSEFKTKHQHIFHCQSCLKKFTGE